jgi:hypothetical protein
MIFTRGYAACVQTPKIDIPRANLAGGIVCEPHTAAVCDHGFPFAAVIEHDNLTAVQFHPEKSGEAGATILRNFLEWVQ